MTKRLIVLLFVLTSLALLFPQQSYAAKLKGIKYIKESKDGLGSREVADIVFDGKKMWFATRRGLYMKEGAKWKRFTDKDGLPTINLTRIANDGNTLWIGGLGGLSRLDKKTGKIEWILLPMATATMKKEWIKEKRDQMDQLVLSIAVDGDDIWVGTHCGAGVYNKKTGKFSPKRYLGDWRGDDYLDIVVDKDKVYTACTYVFAMMDKKTQDWKAKVFCTQTHNFIMGPNDVCMDKDYVWLPSRVGLGRYDKKTGKLGVYIYKGTYPLFKKDSVAKWVSLCNAILSEKETDMVMKRMTEMIPAAVKDEMKKYTAKLEEVIKDDPYSTPPFPNKAIIDALNKPLMSPKFLPDGAVQTNRAILKGEKKLPANVLSVEETVLMKKVKSGKATRGEVAHFNRQAIRRISKYAGSFPVYKAPEECTTTTKGMYSGSAAGKLVPKSIVPVLGKNMGDSWCWSAVVVGDSVWVGTERGLNVMNKKTEETKVYTKEDGLLDSRVARVFYDGKNIWACTTWGINIFPAKQ